ncbi:hypothetical protein C2S52_003952 [Perilla frutescens var. hirtella]|nr:hypothetical protein C2S52_003952 [Perilla frutescens var. hirtella]
MALQQRTLKRPQSAPPKLAVPILYSKAAYQRPNLGVRSVPPQRKSNSDHLSCKKDENMLSVSEISQRLAHVEELYQYLVATPFYAMKFPPAAPIDFRSSSPQFAGVLPIDEIRSVPCRRLSFDEIGDTSAGAVAGATYSTQLYPSGLDFLSAVTLDGDVDFSPFKRWYTSARSLKTACESNNIPVPTQMTLGVVCPWFDKLCNPDGWLQDQHIDALLALIMWQVKAEDALQPEMSLSVMDTLCWKILRQDDWMLVEEIVVPFAKESYIEDWGESWARTRKIVGIAHMKTNHWLSYHISIDDQRIIMYDSTSKDSDWAIVK